MPALRTEPLSNDHPFGVRLFGVASANIQDAEVRAEIRQVFEKDGVILFADAEPSAEMHLALSGVVGPLQTHAYKGVPLVDENLPGLIAITSRPESCDVFLVDGQRLSSWIPWHFDACYTARLNRGAVLRALEVPAFGGMTGFADGIQMYNALPPEIRAQMDDLEIRYHAPLMYPHLRFGLPREYEIIDLKPAKYEMIEGMRSAPHSIHPAVWTRDDGQRVLHLSPWQADGIVGRVGSEGDAVLEELIQEMLRVMNPYLHPWKPGEMIIWDNWRFLHTAAGHPPEYTRVMHRTTIEGDYGLGRFEDGDTARPQLASVE